MFSITMNVPSLSRSRVMRFPNYCHLSKGVEEERISFPPTELVGWAEACKLCYHLVCRRNIECPKRSFSAMK